tara:strand:+ start:124 stop:441 length:318 start_codon:yes stop_codon:yes gene_type:complete
MKLLFFLLISQASAWCLFYDKAGTIEKIRKNLALLGTKDVNRNFFKEQSKKMPRIFSWAVDQIGVEQAFKDCDENNDGTITLKEMAHDSTCLDSCFKMGIVNFAL